MQEAIQGLLCNNGDWGARCLAWAAGTISTDELFGDLEAECKKQRIPFRRPQVA